jgi:protein O-GlcNAc transferase
MKLPEAALTSYDQALAITPDDLEIQYNRANALRDLNRLQEAAQSYQSVIERMPSYDFAFGNLLDAKLHACDWSDYEAVRQAVVATVDAGKWIDSPFIFLSASASAAEQLKCARLYSHEKHPLRLRQLWLEERYPHDRIRVAYLSADFREHAVSHLLAGALERHDHNRFETVAISFKPRAESETGKRIANSFDRFIDVSMKSDSEAAKIIRDLEIDIAVDLMGYTANSRPILAHRPAPIHVSYLGYSGTTGAPFIDYIIADPVVIPSDRAANYSEAIVHLPNSYMPTDSARTIAPLIPTRSESGLPDSAIVFCSFNNPYKFNPPAFDIWMRLLKSIADSVLWLPSMNVDTARNIRGEAKIRGVHAERLVFASRTSTNADHLARLQLADLFLDTLPYNAHATACDALWAGVPVLTCTGEAFAARVAASLLNAVGLPELITANLGEYEALALKLATDRAMLGDLRAKLARNRATAPLFDTDRYCRHLKRAYVAMWERYQRGEAPAGFAVGSD